MRFPKYLNSCAGVLRPPDMLWQDYLSLKSVDDILWCYYSNGTSLVVLLHETIHYLECSLTLESVDEILRFEHSSETSSEVPSHDAICLECSRSFKF